MKPLTAALAAFVVAATLAGCSVGLVEAPMPADTLATPTPAGTPIVLPPQFPLPADATVIGGVRSGDQTIVQVAVTDPGVAYEFWTRALEPAGFMVIEAAGSGSGSEVDRWQIDFLGHGCFEPSQVVIVGPQAVVTCEKF